MVVEIVDSGVASVITMWEFIKQIDKQLSTYYAKEHHFWIDGVYVSDIFQTSKTKDLLKTIYSHRILTVVLILFQF